ncbi:type II toxin-antitoxin system VapC family toxin [Ideonella paludis]|uniref:Ribonuclease VapC n=1 Tax=Ideonella paludis TaxID=1233411 RepID=A0ABS5DTC3_9BURK|nr:type II toxin-antitoxin system VapC family toxin [Ideonella paludis]MBQ0934396.1 type II toxin-antitoxin system VapC family toxin [Ideonella paludis]
MIRFMLDTNTVSDLLKGHAGVLHAVSQKPMAELCVSAITEAELRYGLAKRPQATRLHESVRQLLLRVQTLSWDAAVAQRYGMLRADLEAQGKTLSALDMQIAAHALALGLTLVSRDKAFAQVPALHLEDWTR